MNIQEFQNTACALLRTTVGWQTKIAHKLGVEPRTVRRWVAAGDVPEWVKQRLGVMVGMTDRLPWPRDEWMTGDSPTGDGRFRTYIAHLQVPRFIARIVYLDENQESLASEMPADIISGAVYLSDFQAICEIDWIDEPRAGEVQQLLEAAFDWLDAYDSSSL